MDVHQEISDLKRRVSCLEDLNSESLSPLFVDSAKSSRRSNPWWDELVRVFGLNPVTARERRRVGKIVKDLRAKGVEPRDIARVRRLFLDRYPNAACTPEGLVKHWDQLVAGVKDRGKDADATKSKLDKERAERERIERQRRELDEAYERLSEVERDRYEREVRTAGLFQRVIGRDKSRILRMLIVQAAMSGKETNDAK